jgi:hypothetical protein
MRARSGGQRRPQRFVPDPPGGAVGVLTFRGQQRDTGSGVVVTELRPHILDEPAQRRPGVVDQRHPALYGLRIPLTPEESLAQAGERLVVALAGMLDDPPAGDPPLAARLSSGHRR